MTMRTMLWVAAASMAMMLLGGCFSARPEDLAAFARPEDADVTGDDYIIQPPDRITVIASGVPELSGTGAQLGQTQEIRPDGMISYEKIGEILVAGKTPRQVAEIIGERLSELYKLSGDHPIDVRINNQSKLYYVVGQVRQPGAKIFTGRETTLSAIAKAVPTDYAWKEQIQVVRPARESGQRSHIFRLDWRRMVIHGDTDSIVLLEEGDIIYVPPTIFAAIGLTVGEILGPIFQGARAVEVMAGP